MRIVSHQNFLRHPLKIYSFKSRRILAWVFIYQTDKDKHQHCCWFIMIKILTDSNKDPWIKRLSDANSKWCRLQFWYHWFCRCYWCRYFIMVRNKRYKILIESYDFPFSIDTSNTSNAVVRVDDSVQFSFITIIKRLEFWKVESWIFHKIIQKGNWWDKFATWTWTTDELLDQW